MKHNEKFPLPWGSPLELLPSVEDTLTGFQSQSSRDLESATLMARQEPGPQISYPRKGEVRPSGWDYLPIAPNNLAMAVLQTSEFVRKGIGRLDLE